MQCSIPWSLPCSSAAPWKTYLGGIYDKTVSYIRYEAIDVDSQVTATQRALITGGNGLGNWCDSSKHSKMQAYLIKPD